MTIDEGAVGWIGLGKMGEPMARNLLRNGRALCVFNRTPSRAEALAAEGARLAPSLAAVAEGASIVFTMVSDDPALRAVTCGAEGVLAHLRPGAVLVDMSTVSVAASAEIAEAAEAAGIGYVRAPVSGSVTMAEAGKLTILASGRARDLEAAAPLLAHLGSRIVTVGADEQARVLKLALNLMVGTTAAMLAEALTLGEKAGIDWTTMLEVIGGSAIASPLVGYKLPALKARNFAPMFSAEQIAKDFDLIRAQAVATKVAVPVADCVADYWRRLIAAGRGGEDFIACLAVAEQAAGLAPPPPRN